MKSGVLTKSSAGPFAELVSTDQEKSRLAFSMQRGNIKMTKFDTHVLRDLSKHSYFLIQGAVWNANGNHKNNKMMSKITFNYVLGVPLQNTRRWSCGQDTILLRHVGSLMHFRNFNISNTLWKPSLLMAIGRSVSDDTTCVKTKEEFH